jgi:glucokinase
MSRTIGIVVSSRIVAGLMEDHKLVGELSRYPENPDDHEALLEHPFESLCHLITDQVMALHPEGQIDAIGVALPGIIREGIVEDSPNLAQLKGGKIAETLAAGLAVTQGRTDRLVRVWTIGNGIGFGRYPYTPGVWEGGHMVVTLDPKETYCGCGGRGHLEGIMGYRAMRLRFLDMEPEEVFAAAKKGDARCMEFVRLWHRGLGAATATSIHLGGPGRFYFTGINVRFLDLNLLKEYLWQMVKMSPLQSYALEVVPENSEVAVIGAAASALLAPVT